MSAELPAERLYRVPLAVLLGGSLLAAIRVPGLGIGLSNLLIAGAGLTLLWLYHADLGQHQHRLLPPVLAGLAVWLWSFVSALAGPMPEIGLRSTVKGAFYALALAGGLALFAAPARVSGALRIVLGFLLVLAGFGVVEAIFPESLPFQLLRSEDSLSITPRVASLLPWPNQFGVAMVLGLVVVELLALRLAIGPGVAWGSRLLLLVQVGQSGSRNSWLLLGAVLLLLVLLRTTPWRRAVVLGAVFAAVVVTLPVPARQLGLRQGSWLPAANRLIETPAGWSTSLAHAGLSLNLRLQLWRETVAEIRHHPVAGLGPNVFQAYAGPRVMHELGFNTHNLLLEVWVGLGTVGLLLLASAVTLAVRSRPLGDGVGGLPLAVLLLAQVLDCFTHDPTVVVLMALFAGAAWSRPQPP